MNKSDKLAVAFLAVLLCGWLVYAHQRNEAFRKYAEEHPELFRNDA